jgi:hypothetical protein
MSATYAQIIEGLHERFATVAGIAQILAYEPPSIDAFPTLYSLLDGVQYSNAGQVDPTRYSILHRLVFQWVEQKQAELELMPFVASIPAAVHADKYLGGRLNKGNAIIERCQGTFVTIGGVLFRCLDFYSNVLSK